MFDALVLRQCFGRNKRWLRVSTDIADKVQLRLIIRDVYTVKTRVNVKQLINKIVPSIKVRSHILDPFCAESRMRRWQNSPDLFYPFEELLQITVYLCSPGQLLLVRSRLQHCKQGFRLSADNPGEVQ